MNRREFLGGAALLAAVGLTRKATGETAAEAAVASDAAFMKARTAGRLICSEPMLQAPAETSMGVVWAVTAMANGWVDVSESPDLSNARRYTCGGYGLTGFHERVLQVRLTDLKPATTYYYRIRAERVDYRSDGNRVRGEVEQGGIHRFTTLGAAAPSHFCVINDTHMDRAALGMVMAKLDALKPVATLWNGDAVNCCETIEPAVEAFLTPPVKKQGYAAENPILFNNGNHENRGKWARRMDEILMPRLASERASRDWALTRNFAVRIGDIALIGLDTGDDRGDDHPLSAGLSNFQAYREAQTPWLADALKRPEIASAPYLLASCHIPLLPRASEKDNPMWWTKYGHDNWGPLLTAAKAQAVLVGHMHEYRINPADRARSWAQIEGGGYELGKRRFGATEIVNSGYFPTVMDVRTEDGRLVVEVWDAWHDKVVGRHEFEARLSARRVLGEVRAAVG